MKSLDLNEQQLQKMKTHPGFIAALDQSGGSTPDALRLYGIKEGSWSNEDEMFAIVHQMRTRMITSPSFTGERIIGAILFENTMDRDIQKQPTADYLWNVKRVVPFLKVDKGLASEKDGVMLLKPMPTLAVLLDKAEAKNIFGTKMRSVIKQANPAGIKDIVNQQFEVAAQIIAADLMPIVEPEVDIHCPEKARAEGLLKAAILERLGASWQIEYEEWRNQDLSFLKVVYQWADGIYVKAGLEKDKAALLVIIGAVENGQKALLACESGYRESKESWLGVLRDLRRRGLKLGRLTIADGHLGIWSALGEIHPEGDEQRCCNHKITNVLDAMPGRVRDEAGECINRIPYAETQKECESLRNEFINHYRRDYPKAVEKLLADWKRMLTFYSYPQEHWVHIRTTNVVESPFSSIRLRTDAAIRFRKVQNATAMIWKLLQVAEKNFRSLKGCWLLPDVYSGKRFVDGVMVEENIDKKRKAA